MKNLPAVCRGLLVAGAGSVPLSIVAAQIFLYLGVLLWLVGVIAERRWTAFRQPLAIWAALFVAVCALSAITGLHGAHAFGKLYRLSFLFLLVAVPDLFRNRTREVLWLLGAFVASTVVLSVYDMWRVPNEIASLIAPDIAHTGNMRDPQFYMVATVFLLVAMLSAKDLPKRLWLLSPLLFCLVGLFLHQKMGAFLGLGCAMLGMMLVFRKTTLLLTLGAAVAVVFVTHTEIRNRILYKLDNEFDPAVGARGTLWFVVAPSFIKANPLGAGYKSTEYEDLVQYKGDRHMEVGHEHLHNNLLQVQAELGVLGPVVWLPWMFVTFFVLWRGRGSPVGAAVLLGFVALSANGLMEYNFGDSEPFMLFCLLMGLGQRSS